MVDRNLGTSLELMFGHEGGYVNRKTDRGGPTKYGVTSKTLGNHRRLGRPATAEEVKALGIAEATDIYRRSYWSQSGGSLLPDGLDYAAFDFGVNSGPARSVKTLQKLVGAGVDGIVGEETVNAVLKYPEGLQQLIKDFIDARMKFLRSLGGDTGWSSNGRGWSIRVTGVDPLGKWPDVDGVLQHSLNMARRVPKIVTSVPVSVEEIGGTAKASPKDISILDILKRPEALAPLGGVLSAFGGIVAGSGPIQWALAVCMVVGVGVGVYYLVNRIRNNG